MIVAEPPDITPILEPAQAFSLDHQSLADTVAEFLVAEMQKERERILLGYGPFSRGAVAWVYDRIVSLVRAKAPDAIRRVIDHVGSMSIDQVLAMAEARKREHSQEN